MSTIEIDDPLELCRRIRAALDRREAGVGGPLRFENLVYEAICHRKMRNLDEVALQLREPVERVRGVWDTLRAWAAEEK
jgi:hypothetical protein